MDEDYLSWLLIVPGLSRRRAALLAETFPSIEALRAAPLVDIAGIAGIGDSLARRIKDFAETAGPGADPQYGDDAGLYLCPECGALIAKRATRCPFCNVSFEGEEPGAGDAPIGAPPAAEDRPGSARPERGALNLCPSCGAFVDAAASRCPRCGVALEGEEVVEGDIVGGTRRPADLLEPAGQELFLCANCGSLVGGDVGVCPRCGMALEGEEEAPPTAPEPVASLPPEAITGEGSLFVCTNCGAFLRADETKCPACGVEFEEGVVAEAASAAEEGATQFFPICPSCGALVPGSARRCGICGHRMGEPVATKPMPPPTDEIGISRDFMERWRRIAEEKAGLTPENRLLDELDQYEQLLASDPKLERAWLKKAGILLRLGRVREAVACYERLADLNPTREEDYRLQVLSILQVQNDRSLLPRRWSRIAATEPARDIAPPKIPTRRVEAKEVPAAAEPRADAVEILRALDFYDRLLRADPSLVVAWRTKSELLERLGRRTAATAARQRADSLLSAAREGLRTSAPRTAPRLEGRVNGSGRTNGRTNGKGRINGIGRINGTGRINGVGRINGIGRVNGMDRASGSGRVNGVGRTNGAVSAGRTDGLQTGLTSGMAPGEGMVNGLVNGTGMTNGRRGRWAPPRPGAPRSWMRSVVGIAAAVLLLLLMPILATLVWESPPGGIAIDGEFRDWDGVPAYVDAFQDQVGNLDVNLRLYKVRATEGALAIDARVEGLLFRGSSGGSDSLFVFVDEDGDNGTGFQTGSIGAERAFEVYGWDRLLQGTTTWVFDEARAGPSSDDWRSFVASGSGEAANNDREVELRFELGPRYDEDRARIRLHAGDTLGNGDPSDVTIGTRLGALAVFQATIAPEIVSGASVPFLAFRITPHGASLGVDSITIMKEGSIPDANITGSLYRDGDADGVLDASDPLLATQPVGPTATFALGATLTPPNGASFILSANLLAPSPNASLGLRVVSILPSAGAATPVTVDTAGLTRAYVAGAPPSIAIDGAFADWNRFATRGDSDDDVRSAGGNGTVYDNVDLREYDAVIGADVAMYVRVDGRILGGADVPNSRARTGPTPITIDSDGDTVPDDVEAAMAPGLAYDFNNDNVSDAIQFEDVDQDGVLDYNRCQIADCSAYTDYLLETSLPLWYPSPYSGRAVRRYIGPVSLPPQRGVDHAYAYIDRDNRTDTGLLTYVNGVPQGMDFVYEAVGRGGRVLNAALYAYNASGSIPWSRIASVATEIDSTRLEAAFPAGLVNLTQNRTFHFVTTDWRSASDESDTPSPGGVPRASTRFGRPQDTAGLPNELVDIPGNQRFYLRDADHATETACATNKVASTIPGSGPAVSISVGPGQSACWYADATSGGTSFVGDWEALLDIFVAHGIALYGENGAANPRFREWTGAAFGPEGSASAVPGTEQWVVVAPSPLGPEMVVGILSDNNRLYVQTWSGGVWTANWDVAIGGSNSRRFDIAYEEQSGDVLVVFGDGTTQLRYRRRIGGVWDGANLNAGTPLPAFPRWVRTAPRPTNDDVFIGLVTNSETMHALRWDGTANAMGNQVQMSQGTQLSGQEPFDIAFERTSGDAFVIWGSSVSTLRYREFTGAWQAEGVAYSMPDDARWVVADHDPRATASTIAVGMVLQNGDFEFGAWDGTTWVTRPAAIAARDQNQRGIDVAFERGTGRAIYVFNQNANPAQVAYRNWTTAGFGAVTVAPGSTGNLRFVQLRSSPHRDEIMALLSDARNDLSHRLWSGSSWSALAAPLEATMSVSGQREPFMFAWTRVVEYDVHFEIWNMTTNTVRETIGSCLDQRVYGDDVPCVISGVPVKVIAPDEVVRIRIAHSSVGGTFRIWYDDAAPPANSRVTIPIPEFATVLAPLAVPILLYAVRRARRRRRVAADGVPGPGGR